MSSSIILASGSLSLTITRFSNASYPRERIDGPTLSYSAYGSPVREGTWFEPKHIWNIEARLNATERLMLDRLYAYWLLSDPKPAIILSDQTRQFTEPSPRTRALASGATETIADGMTSYFAQFQVEFGQEPKYSQDGAFVVASLQLMETVKVPA